jgi:exosome complex exonuclease RRP6
VHIVASLQVLHGCSSDVVWLQRDFGLYLVNVFDSGEAAKFLQYPSFGLAHLLHVFCGVTAQKQYQVRRHPLLVSRTCVAA